MFGIVLTIVGGAGFLLALTGLFIAARDLIRNWA